ncbi:unnamed protein product [Cylindrotheca closterium]|uniref:Uncharacterized protein n=1 Tax=Cylindrotheca closterium TaxID=2856 RepID=A0AAD2PY08_9STRA|nr:unnamed protein product [Cylindrotheca closterium]
MILHSDHEISYLWTDDEDEESSSAESTEEQRWSLTEGMPPSQPMRRNSPLTSGYNAPPKAPERRTSNDEGKGDNCHSDDSTSQRSTNSAEPSDNVAIKDSLDGDLAKIGMRDISKLANLKLHEHKDEKDDNKAEDSGESLLVMKGEDYDTYCNSERSTRSIASDLANTDHWSPLLDEDNDYSPPTLPMRRGSGGDLISGDLKNGQTLSTMPEDEDDDMSQWSDYDNELLPPPPFDS